MPSPMRTNLFITCLLALMFQVALCLGEGAPLNGLHYRPAKGSFADAIPRRVDNKKITHLAV
ncbi:MAG: hypothetical protein ACOYMN_23640 [Roseimicrobium sp.]